jgi:hypothetical protein
MAYRFMEEHKGQYTMREMAGVFRVSDSVYYKPVKAGESGEGSGNDEELIRLIQKIMEKHHWRYGSPRVREGLRKD